MKYEAQNPVQAICANVVDVAGVYKCHGGDSQEESKGKRENAKKMKY